MSFFRWLKTYTKPISSHSSPTNVGRNHSPEDFNKPRQSRQTNESAPATRRPWRRKKLSRTDDTRSSPLSTTHPPPTPNAKVESPTSDGGVYQMPVIMPLPFTPGFSPTNLAIAPPPEAMPPLSPTSDRIVQAWDAVKDGPKFSNINRELDVVGACSALSHRLLNCMMIFVSR